ncbi:hypothetical protein B0H14DRAFT_3704418 [Mycena olivaceomarginata]|nr:hypothetical protein B0H14DRAFT_3704418 [Mycena olivaceomarginata]
MNDRDIDQALENYKDIRLGTVHRKIRIYSHGEIRCKTPFGNYHQTQYFPCCSTSDMPPNLKSKKGQDVFAPEASVVEYNHRNVRFIKLRGERIHYSPDGSKPDITFYVHHLVQDNGSLIGRCPRIFCVWRETRATAASDVSWDPTPSRSTTRIMQVMVSKMILLVRLDVHREWYYGDALSMRGFPPEVVQRYTNTQAATLVPNVVSNREEVFAQSDLKRLLLQCSDYDELKKAYTDFTGGIASLAEQDLMRQPSAGALLRVPVSFTQNPLEQRMGGLIHDMGMAGRLHRLPEQSSADDYTSTADLLAMLLDTPGPPARAEQPVGQQKGFRTGTPPFMAIGLLVDGGPHLVAYDLTSPPATQPIICYGVIFLEPPHVPFRHSLSSVGAREEQDMAPGCVAVGEPPGRVPPRRAGIVKRGFFSKPQILQDIFQDTLGEEALWTADPKYLRLFWALYGALWMAVPEKSEWIDRSNVTPADVEQALANHRQVRARIN